MKFVSREQFEETLRIAGALYRYRHLFKDGDDSDEQFVESMATLIHMITSPPWESMSEADFLDCISKSAPRPQA